MQPSEILEQIVYPVAREFRATATHPERLLEKPETPLFGPRGALDSIAFVSFLLAIEAQAQEVTQKSLRLLDNQAFSQRQNPFATLESVALYLQMRLAN